MADPPDPLAALLCELEGAGFIRRLDETSASFGDRIIEVADQTQAVQLVRDRSRWSVSVRVSGAWWDPEAVLAVLARRAASAEAPSEQAIADSTREALARLRAGIGIRALWMGQSLKLAQRRRARRRARMLARSGS